QPCWTPKASKTWLIPENAAVCSGRTSDATFADAAAGPDGSAAVATAIAAEAFASEPGDEVAALAPAATATEPAPVKSNAAVVMDSLTRVFIGAIFSWSAVGAFPAGSAGSARHSLAAVAARRCCGCYRSAVEA